MNKKAGNVMDIKQLSADLKIPKMKLCGLAGERRIPRRKIGCHWRFRNVAILGLYHFHKEVNSKSTGNLLERKYANQYRLIKAELKS